MLLLKLAAVILCVLCFVLYYYGYLGTVIKLLVYFGAGLLGVCISKISLFSEKICARKRKISCNSALQKMAQEKIQEHELLMKDVTHKQPALISRNVDDVVDEIISLLLRDFIHHWYSSLVNKHTFFIKLLKNEIWQILNTLKNKCQKIDEVNFFTSDVVHTVNEHLQHIRNSAGNSSEKIPYKVYSFLANREDELEYLRKISDFLLATLLPVKYAKCLPLRHLLREVFATTVFYHLIDLTSDPDFINLKLVSYMKSQQREAEKHNRTYAYAETYEDFIKMIQECGSVEALQRMRYYIVTEILQATTISNLKRSKGIDADKEFNPQKTNKGDLLQARNLSRYLNQLRFAKGLCEKRLKMQGELDSVSTSKDATKITFEKTHIPGRKVLAMPVIMQSSFCRRAFSKFLQKEEKHSLLGFWEAVEDMKQTDKAMWHKLGNDIAQMYIHNQSSGVRLHKNILKGIEAFMMANKGPEAFFQAQEAMYKVLEDNFYASFIVSDIYHKMLTEADNQGIDFTQVIEDMEDESESMNSATHKEKSDENLDVSVFDHSSHARLQLKHLEEKLSYKIQAHRALRANPKCEKKLVVQKLEKEIEDLGIEHHLLEDHIDKTELWIKYLGIWQATVHDAEIAKENDKPVPYFSILVHIGGHMSVPNLESAGWVVCRSLGTFHNLHQKLVPAASWLKKIELPTKPRFKSYDKNYLDKAKVCLQMFLSAVTKDDELNKSEALYSFLSPSPEHMKHPLCPPKKPFKFSLLHFFKGVQSPFGQIDDSDEEDELLFLDDSDMKEDRKDSIAEPLYSLIGEIFELKGVFNWLRRTLILFVQVAYGQTINRKLRETIMWILSESMLLYYLQTFRDSMWPKGQLQTSVAHRTKTQKLETKLQARKLLLSNIPEVLSNLIGQQNAKKGIVKIFEALQNKTLNKQLLYNIFEAFIYEFAPELKGANC